MTAIDVNRGTTGISLPASVAEAVWTNTARQSIVMQLAQQVALPGNGASVPIITGDPVAAWTDETAEAAVSTPTFATKTITPYKLTVLVPFSNEFRRDLDTLYGEIVNSMPSAIAKKFDQTVFGAAAAPGANFDTLGGCTAINIQTNTWDALVTAKDTVSVNDGAIDGWVVTPQGESILLATKDSTGHPLFVDSVGNGTVERLLGQPVHIDKTPYIAAVTTGDAKKPAQLGVAGEWSSARYGVVENFKMSLSDQGTLTSGDDTINLFQRGMFAVKLEFEAGFRVRDTGRFVRLVGNTPA